MEVSRRQFFLSVAAMCVLTGAMRLEAFSPSILDSEDGSIASKHRVEIRSPKALQLTDYAECLENISGHEESLVQAAVESRIDPKLLLAVMTVESECETDSQSKRGAVGLMQILPSTARSVGKFDAHTPGDNIRAGALYLRELKDKFGADIRLTLAAYNAGPTAVRKYKGVPPYKETKNYVNKVLKVYNGYKL